MKHLLREMRPTLPQTAMAIGHMLETENEGYDMMAAAVGGGGICMHHLETSGKSQKKDKSTTLLRILPS